MAAPIQASTAAAARRGFGLLQLASLLAAAIVAAILLTAYLLRLDRSGGQAGIAPAPYRVLVQSGSTLWSIGPDDMPKNVVANLPQSGHITLRVARDGSRMIGIDTEQRETRVWLWLAAAGPPRLLSGPPPSLGAGPWNLVEATWSGSRTFAVLLRHGGPGATAILGQFKLKSSAAVAGIWSSLAAPHRNPISISPDGSQIAGAEIRPRVMALQARSRCGWRGCRAGRIRWRSATLAMRRHNRFSGRPTEERWRFRRQRGARHPEVEWQARARCSGWQLPAAFSPLGAALAYVSGGGSSWQIHVLNLHGEIDNTLPPPAIGAPTMLGWTPDARALLYGVGGALWQVDAASAAATLLKGGVSGSLVGILPAAAPFAGGSRL